MKESSSWAGDIGGAAASAAKGAWLGLETAAVIASSPAAALEDVSLTISDPVGQSGLTALAESHDALASAIEAKSTEDDVSEAISVSDEATTSLTVDQPSWMADPTDLEQSIGEDLGFFAGEGADLSAEGSEDSSDMGRDSV